MAAKARGARRAGANPPPAGRGPPCFLRLHPGAGLWLLGVVEPHGGHALMATKPSPLPFRPVCGSPAPPSARPPHRGLVAVPL